MHDKRKVTSCDRRTAMHIARDQNVGRVTRSGKLASRKTGGDELVSTNDNTEVHVAGTKARHGQIARDDIVSSNHHTATHANAGGINVALKYRGAMDSHSDKLVRCENGRLHRVTATANGAIDAVTSCDHTNHRKLDHEIIGDKTSIDKTAEATPVNGPYALPIDILLVLARDHLPIPTLASLAKTDRRLNSLCQPLLYRTAAFEDEAHTEVITKYGLPRSWTSLTTFLNPKEPLVLWAARRGRCDILEQYRRHSRHPSHLTATFRRPFVQCHHDRDNNHPWTPRHRINATVDAATGVLKFRIRGFWASAQYTSTMTALHLASQNGQTRTVSWLLAAGAHSHLDALVTRPCVCPSLHVRFLGDYHNVVSAEDAPVATPLHLAIAHGHEATVQLLLEHATDTSTWATAHPDAYVSSALCIMAANSMVRPLRWLALRHADAFRKAVLHRDVVGLFPVSYAAFIEDIQIRREVEHLLEE